MPIGSKSEDIAVVGRFRKFVAARAQKWYLYANNVREREAKNGDLRLIIGLDKTSAWGMATFSHRAAQEIPCILKLLPCGDRNASGTYSWDYTGSAQARSGPDAHQIESLQGNDPSEQGVHYDNQTLFVRTMNVTLQDNVWKQLEFEIAELNLDTQAMHGPGHFSSSLQGMKIGPQVQSEVLDGSFSSTHSNSMVCIPLKSGCNKGSSTTLRQSNSELASVKRD